ncbi:MAG: hypothetical protein IPN19_03100 [Elusimicrobia bacterium]|nr:hypothetical protein [Elusimicrobiota bacterium]
MFGIAWTASGLVPIFRQDWAGTPIKDMLAYPLLVAVLWGSIATLARISGLSWEASGIGIGIAISFFSGRARAVGAVSLFVLSSWAVGDLVGRPFWPSDKGNNLGKALLGAGLWGTLVGVLASLPIHTPGLHATALVVPIIVRHRQIWTQVKGWKQELSSAPQFNRDGLLTGLVFSVALIHFLLAFSPELGADALVSHLFVPGFVAAHHLWSFDVRTYVFAVQPMLGDWIFTINYLLAGEYAARIVNVFFLYCLALLVQDLAIWAGGNSRGGKWASLLLLSTPLSLLESSSLFIECEWACFLLAAVLVLARGLTDLEGFEKKVMLAGVWLGFGMGTKLISITMIPFLGCLVLWVAYRTGLKRISWPIISSLGLFAIVGGIPYLRAWVETGNPTFPFFNDIFKSPLFLIHNFKNARFVHGLGFDLLGKIVFQTNIFLECRPGVAGFQWSLILIPAVISSVMVKSWRTLILFLVAIGTLLITFHFQTYLRYVFPSVAILISVIASGLFCFQYTERHPRLLRLTGLLGAVGVNLFFFPKGSFYGKFPFRAAFSSKAREELLVHARPMRLAVEVVNGVNTAKEPVAVFGPPYVAGIQSDFLHPSWYNYDFKGAMASVTNSESLGQILIDRRVDFVLLQNDWGSIEQRRWVKELSNVVAEFGTVSVLELKPNVRFGRELIKNPNFSSTDGWSLGAETMFLEGKHRMLVNGPSPATQVVPVLPKRRYINRVVARCAEVPEALGRLQINWAGDDMGFLKADIDVFPCSQEGGEYSMTVVSPEHAAFAHVYASGHGVQFIEFEGVSLK